MPNFKIPPQLAHLKIESRGYPVPYFVGIIDGEPNFKFLNERKQHECMEHHLCGICGKKLYKDYSYFISGPIGLRNAVSTDPAMHRVCAEFALESCPHLKFQKAIRKENKSDKKDYYMIEEKPEVMVMVKSSKYKKFIEPVNKRWLYRYTPVRVWAYAYRDGILEFAAECSPGDFDDLFRSLIKK